MTKLKLSTSLLEYEKAMKWLDKRGKSATVPRKLLNKILIDHGVMYGALRDANIQIEEK